MICMKYVVWDKHELTQQPRHLVCTYCAALKRLYRRIWLASRLSIGFASAAHD